MREFWKSFIHRGLLAAGGGPVVLAILYGIFGGNDLSGSQVCLGILTLTLLAFVVAGMGAIYQIEQLPLSFAILIHGAVLYISYILIYLVNGWLKKQWTPILIFTGVFLISYTLIWCLIYLTTRSKTKKINDNLQN